MLSVLESIVLLMQDCFKMVNAKTVTCIPSKLMKKIVKTLNVLQIKRNCQMVNVNLVLYTLDLLKTKSHVHLRNVTATQYF